jgi:putative FmdB family regulatory protein
MPIYEFFCDHCNVIFNFFSSRIDTVSAPACPRCAKEKLERRISTFATIGKAKEDSDDMLSGLDESKMEQAFNTLMRDAEGMNEEDPRQMAALMRKFSQKTGINLGGSMEEAISRMEAGEDPEQVEREMGDLLGGDDDFSLESLKKKVSAGRKMPLHDEKLYDLTPHKEQKAGH